MLRNIRHERFAQGIAKGLPAADAYTQAGYKATGASARVNASRLLTNPNVASRLAELAAKLAKPAIADADEIQQFLTTAMRGKDETGDDLTEDHVTKDGVVVPVRISWRDRLKAAELLARAQGVFATAGSDSDGELDAIARALAERASPAPLN